MKFKIFIKSITIFVQIILAMVIFIVFTAFALNPTEILFFTNALILIMIMVELYTVNMLTELYEKLEGRKR